MKTWCIFLKYFLLVEAAINWPKEKNIIDYQYTIKTTYWKFMILIIIHNTIYTVKSMTLLKITENDIIQIILIYREKGISTLQIYQYWIFHHTVIEPVLRCKNPQNTKNYDAIQVINTPIFLIILKFFGWSPNFNLRSFLTVPLFLYFGSEQFHPFWIIERIFPIFSKPVFIIENVGDYTIE